jgi:hypothetical protein
LYKPDITYLKEVARHLIHINEAFLVAGDTLESIMHHHVNYFRECERIEATTAVAVAPELAAGRQKLHSRIQERLYIANKEIRAIKSRASTLSERLDNEIDLVSAIIKIGNIILMLNSTTINCLLPLPKAPVVITRQCRL